jgi:hypothetical protein
MTEVTTSSRLPCIAAFLPHELPSSAARGMAHWKAVSLVSTPRSVRAAPGNSHSQNRALRSGPPLAMLASTASYTALQHVESGRACSCEVISLQQLAWGRQGIAAYRPTCSRGRGLS